MKKSIKNAIFAFIIGLFVFVVINNFFVSIVSIHGNSMFPTLGDGDKILVSKLGISPQKIRKNEIVIIEGNDGVIYVKRVIATPKDYVEIVKGKVKVNGTFIEENYVRGYETEVYNQNRWQLSEDEVFVLGDNRNYNNSKDSRIFGGIKIKQIKSKMIFKFGR